MVMLVLSFRPRTFLTQDRGAGAERTVPTEGTRYGRRLDRSTLIRGRIAAHPDHLTGNLTR